MPEKEILPEPEDDTPKPWETFAREQEVRAQAPDLQEEISGDESEEEPEDADMGMSKELDDFEGAEDVMEEEPEEESEDEPEEESADDDDKE